ncbi:MAG: hypothetical protein J0H36_00685 [Hyphomicrobium denitrificans]|nr:hypothetical protein [Hyphomicrobium denitrificans]
MSESIQKSVPGVLKTLWDMENELRSAAQSGVILRGEDARNHLQQARYHLDQLLGLANGAPTAAQVDKSTDATANTNSNDN